MEITSFAAEITLEKMAQTYQKHQVGVLKGAMEAQEMIQAELAAMLRDIQPQLAQNVDIQA
jgi:hypothetical protein